MTGIHYRFLFKRLSASDKEKLRSSSPLDFTPLLVNIYSGISETDFLVGCCFIVENKQWCMRRRVIQHRL